MHVNKVIIVGNLGRAPESRYMPDMFGREVERLAAAIGTSKSSTPTNILASASAATDATADSNGGVVGDRGGDISGGSGDGNGDGDGDPDSDWRRSPPPTSPHSKRQTTPRSVRTGKSQQHSNPHSSSSSCPRVPKPAIPERRSKRVHWMAFILTLTAMGGAVWFAEKGYHPVAASAFAGAFAHCIQTLLKT